MATHRTDPGKDWEGIISQLNPGDTLVFEPGVYTHDYLLFELIGTEDAFITLRSDPSMGSPVVFTGSNRINIHSRYVNLIGLNFRDYGGDVLKVGDDGGYKSIGIQIKDCSFVDNRGRPVLLSNIDRCFIEGCVFARTNTHKLNEGAHCIEPIIVDNIIIRNNEFFDNASDCIQLGGIGRAVIGLFVIEGNKFVSPGANEEWGENGIDIKYIGNGPIKVRGNKFIGYRPVAPDGIGHKGGSQGTGLVLHVGAQNVVVENNEFNDCTIGIAVSDQTHRGKPPTRNNTIRHNLITGSKDFAGNDKRPSGNGIGIKINNLPASNIFHNNILVDCDLPIRVSDSPNITLEENLIFSTVADYERWLGDEVIDDTNPLLDRVVALEADVAAIQDKLATWDDVQARMNLLESTLADLSGDLSSLELAIVRSLDEAKRILAE